MPLINGFKYSCEPCIRGHRATSCTHTDRILIEVRKPGRPLESCGHDFSTCQCGKVAALFSVGNGLDGSLMNNVSSDFSMDQGQGPTFFVDVQPAVNKTALEPKKSKAKSRVRRPSRVGKKTRATPEQSSKSPSLTRSSRETSTSTITPASEGENQEHSVGEPRSTAASHHYSLPPLTGDISNPYGRPSVPHVQSQAYSNGSSRTDDIGALPPLGSSQTRGQTMRSQYIMATNNEIWRAT